MPLVGSIGDIVQTPAEMTVEWRVGDFSSLSDKEGDFYDSPVFCFADSLWCLRLHPYEETYFQPVEKEATIRLVRQDSGPHQNIRGTFGYRCSNGVEKRSKEWEEKFPSDCSDWPCESWSWAELKSGSVPSSGLTITCRLNCSDRNTAKVSWSRRMCDLKSGMEAILVDGKRSDFTLKLGDRDWPVHKVILENRCEYFANMFRHDWMENTAGEVTFQDVQEESLDSVLRFIYTGDVRGMSWENVCDVYVAAHKFLLRDLKALCVEFMRGDMDEGIVYRALVIAYTYGEEDLLQSVIDYFLENHEYLFDSVEWKDFKKNHPSIAAELLEETTKREGRRRKEIEKSRVKGVMFK